MNAKELWDSTYAEKDIRPSDTVKGFAVHFAEYYHRAKVDDINEANEMLLDFVRSFKQRAYDAWKPVQMFRSDAEVEVDEIKRELLEEIEQEAEALLKDCDKLLNQ